jgi:hypothetical protein
MSSARVEWLRSAAGMFLSSNSQTVSVKKTLNRS